MINEDLLGSHPRADAEVRPLETSLQNSDPELTRPSLVSTISGSEIIEDSTRIRAIVKSLIAARSWAWIRGSGSTPVNEILGRVVECQDDVEPSRSVLELEVDLERPKDLLAPAQIQTFGYNSGFSFHVLRLEPRKNRIAVPLPPSIVRVRGQRFRRITAPPHTTVRFTHPTSRTHEVVRPVLDLSFRGIGFSLSTAGGDGVVVGAEIPLLEVCLADGTIITMRGLVRHVSRLLQHGTIACGVQVEPRSAWDTERWLSLVAAQLYPNTRSTCGLDDQIWELYVKSGYFDLADMESENGRGIARVRRAFSFAHERLAHAPDLGCQVSWPNGQRVEATVTLIKPYAHTWVGYQLARRHDGAPPAPGRQILRDVLLHGYEYPQRDPDFRWMVTWVRRDGRFSRLLMYELTRRYVVDPCRADLVYFRAMGGSCDEKISFMHPSGFSAGSGTGEEISLLLSVLARTRSVAYCESHDFVPQRFDLNTIKKHWKGAGLSRDRHVLVARRHGTPTAAAICEIAEEGLHLYGLFDLVRLVPLCDSGEADFTYLLLAARAWFAEQGKKQFAYFCETADFAHATRAGLRDLGEADLTILAAELMPDQLEHAWEITAPASK